jgi:adenylate cyclase
VTVPRSAEIPAALVRDELDRVVKSAAFARADRLKRFLRFVVEQTLEGRQTEIKESTIALDVCGRDPTFDAKVDAIVRVDATRLRARLAEYYACEGRSDAIHIGLPKGSYVPTFPGEARRDLRDANAGRLGGRAAVREHRS